MLYSRAMGNASCCAGVDAGPPLTPGLTPWEKIRPALLAGLTVALYCRVLTALFSDWLRDPNFSHGFFVPVISAWIVWSRRAGLAKLEKRPSNWGLLGIVGAIGILLAGILGSEVFLARTSLVILIGAMVVFFLGWNWLRELLFPWLFLLMMIPIPAIVFNQIAFPLQLLASKLATALLSMVGVPVLRDGNVISLAAMQLEVAEACSGIRSLMSLGTLALVYGYFAESKMYKRVILALAAIPIAIAANALRIFGTGLCVQYWDPSKAEGFFHEFSGWVMFVVSVIFLIVMHSVLNLLDRRRAA